MTTPLPRTPEEALEAGWRDGEKDKPTDAIRQRWVALGLPSHLAALSQQQDKPLDAA
jgi:hypothetical protein